MLNAAPAEPSAVMGTETASALEKPKSGFKMKVNFSAMAGKSGTPSKAAPV